MSGTDSPTAANTITCLSEIDGPSWLTEEIAVSGCFPAEAAAELVDAHAIAAVVDLREEECDDEHALRGAGMAFLHLPTPDLHPASVEQLDRGVAFAREHSERGGRVLIHCMHGVGRSPLLALCVMVDLGMEPLEALAQAKDRRVELSPSEMQYRGWAEWLERHGHAAPSYHEFGCIAYRHLAQS